MKRSEHREAIDRACRRIESSDKSPDLATLAAEAGLSPWHFQRLFKAAVGLSPKRYAMARREQDFGRTLAGARSVTDAIYDSGYATSSAAYRDSQSLGMPPAALKNGGVNESIRYATAKTSLGPILVAATVRGPVALATALGRDWDERLHADAKWSLLLIEFRLYAARLPAVNRRYAALHARLRRAMADVVEQEAAETGETLAVDAEDMLRAALALGTGAVLERAAEGDRFPSHLMEIANRAMLVGLVAPSEAPAARARRRSAS